MKPKARVLIVDDDPEFGTVAQHLVEEEGYQVQLVTNRTAAMQTCLQTDFDVVLLDLQLGTDSGLDVLRELHQGWPDLPVIVITAHGSLESAAAAVRSNAFDYVGKPFPAKDLLFVLQRALEWRVARRDTATPHPIITHPLPLSWVTALQWSQCID